MTGITIPDSVTTIGVHAFGWCSDLTSITIPDSVTSIGNHAFFGCHDLTSITILDSITTIGDSAFRNCSSLTSITISEKVTSIAKNAFTDSGLTKIKGKKGSYAETYAKNNGYIFVAIDNDIPEEGGDTTPDAVFLEGDADCSGTVNLEDATIVLRIAVGIKSKNPISEQGQKNADFDKSGKVDLKDATYTLKTAVGIKFTLPEI